MSRTPTAPNGPNSRSLDFYDLDASTLLKSGRELLRVYSGIPEDDIDRHVETIVSPSLHALWLNALLTIQWRKEAFNVRPYPCIGMFQSLDLSLMTTDVYQEVLQRVKQGEKFLDLGCCLGQEFRKLVFDGARSANTYGSDLWGGFFSVGYELFKDQDKLRTSFIAADIFESSSPLTQLDGQMSITYTGALFHLFSLEEQECIALRVVQLLIARPGALLIGRQSGNETAGDFSRSGDTSGRKHYRHNVQSWKELWARIGRKTGTKWSVVANLDSAEYSLVAVEGRSIEIQNKMRNMGLRYTVRRL